MGIIISFIRRITRRVPMRNPDVEMPEGLRQLQLEELRFYPNPIRDVPRDEMQQGSRLMELDPRRYQYHPTNRTEAFYYYDGESWFVLPARRGRQLLQGVD